MSAECSKNYICTSKLGHVQIRFSYVIQNWLLMSKRRKYRWLYIWCCWQVANTFVALTFFIVNSPGYRLPKSKNEFKLLYVKCHWIKFSQFTCHLSAKFFYDLPVCVLQRSRFLKLTIIWVTREVIVSHDYVSF